jgi:large subunit ribosomal protein L3
MLKSIIGTKIGMTQVFDETGNIIPVSVVQAGPCIITSVRTKEKDGYAAIQMGFGDVKKEKNLSKAYLGQFKKKNLAPKKFVQEFRVDDAANYQIGQEIKVDLFQSGDFVDVTGLTKGKGFAGTVKRHGFGGGPSTHGQSDRQRAPGAIGAQGFQRVIKGLRMAGHLGNEYVTIQRLKIVTVDPEKNVLLIRGALPGINRGIVVIENTVKRVKAAVEPKGKAADKKKAASAKGGKK